MKIIEVFANRRSGHHALISWLITNITGQVHDFNKHLNSVEYFDGLIHINDALFNKETAINTYNNNVENGVSFILNYEENDITESIIKGIEPKKVIFIRDFLNVMASKTVAPNMQGMYGGLESENIINENIFTWKRLAKHYIESDTHKMKYEDFIGNEEIRNNFLNILTGLEDKYDPLNLKGTNSSFENRYTQEDLNNRYKKVNFSENFKSIVKNDKELNEIIESLNYTKIENILK